MFSRAVVLWFLSRDAFDPGPIEHAAETLRLAVFVPMRRTDPLCLDTNPQVLVGVPMQDRPEDK